MFVKLLAFKHTFFLTIEKTAKYASLSPPWLDLKQIFTLKKNNILCSFELEVQTKCLKWKLKWITSVQIKKEKGAFSASTWVFLFSLCYDIVGYYRNVAFENSFFCCWNYNTVIVWNVWNYAKVRFWINRFFRSWEKVENVHILFRNLKGEIF